MSLAWPQWGEQGFRTVQGKNCCRSNSTERELAEGGWQSTEGPGWAFLGPWSLGSGWRKGPSYITFNQRLGADREGEILFDIPYT